MRSSILIALSIFTLGAANVACLVWWRYLAWG